MSTIMRFSNTPIPFPQQITQESELEFLPSSILNPPGQPFRKRYTTQTSQLCVSPTSPHKRSSNLPQDLKYLEAIEHLNIKPQERTYEEIQNLAKLTASMPYFQDMNRKSINKSERVHERCCAVLRYEFFQKGNVVFNAEEKPDKFFIIFSGSVNILIPKTEANYKRDLSRKNAVKITKNLVERYNKQTKKQSIDTDSSSEDEKHENDLGGMSPSKLKGELTRYTELLGGVALADLNPEQIEDIFVDGALRFTYYTNLKEGYCFGELGLLRGKPRSATVICKEDCHFAVMMAEDYKNIVAVIERKKMYNKFEFFKNFLVKGIAYDNLAKLAYSFEKKKYSRNEYIFKEGEPGNEVFLIKTGEIQIHKILIERSQKNKKLMPNGFEFNGRKIPLLETFNKKNQIPIQKLITLLQGEFFGEDEIVNNNNPNENYHLRTYSAIVSSPKASIYVCTVQFFKKYIFERPNLLKKLREKYFIKKELWEKQLTNCMAHRKDIHYKEKCKSNTAIPEENQQISVFSERFSEENRPRLTEVNGSVVALDGQMTVKKSVKDLRSKIAEMSHRKVFRQEITKIGTSRIKDKFINDSHLLLDIQEEKIPMNASISTRHKTNSLADHLQFINKKYEEFVKDKQNKVIEPLKFHEEKEGQFKSRVNVYLKGKFRRYFNKSVDQKKMGLKKSNSQRFNESLMKSIKSIRNREKLDPKSMRLSFLDEKNVSLNESGNRVCIKTNRQLTYLTKIDLRNNSNMENSAFGSVSNRQSNCK